jgi:phosphoribosyl-AMP cyclohydrolase
VVEGIKFNDKRLVPAIVQDADSGDVLMLGYMNAEALRRTLTSGEVWFYSRSRQQLWHKGETSGNRLLVREVWKDCDNDTILVKAKPLGPVCHTGERTCFFQELTDPDSAPG